MQTGISISYGKSVLVLLYLIQYMVLLRNYATLNINCLQSKNKQSLLNAFIRQNSIDILLLQEVNTENFDFIGPQYDYVVNTGDENRGTAVIYRCGLTVDAIEKHPSGRVIAMKINNIQTDITLPIYGKGSWKLNNTLLHIPEISEQFSQHFEKLKCKANKSKLNIMQNRNCVEFSHQLNIRSVSKPRPAMRVVPPISGGEDQVDCDIVLGWMSYDGPGVIERIDGRFNTETKGSNILFQYTMDDDFDEFIEFYNENENVFRPNKRYIRDMENPLEMYSDQQFKRRYRFNKNTVVDILVPLIENHNTTMRGLPISPLLKILVALRFYATASFQSRDIPYCLEIFDDVQNGRQSPRVPTRTSCMRVANSRTSKIVHSLRIVGPLIILVKLFMHLVCKQHFTYFLLRAVTDEYILMLCKSSLSDLRDSIKPISVTWCHYGTSVLTIMASVKHFHLMHNKFGTVSVIITIAIRITYILETMFVIIDINIIALLIFNKFDRRFVFSRFKINIVACPFRSKFAGFLHWFGLKPDGSVLGINTFDLITPLFDYLFFSQLFFPIFSVMIPAATETGTNDNEKDESFGHETYNVLKRKHILRLRFGRVH
ncbi:hypothetical protein ANN_17768 [Periplaneta americana]|uniref:Endonuclease/exonuclease/phosphatase domain-containing protein n=1 Tax=Periplaneta americana TaxID=6978 RepID=A0ABQ8STV1_PERAM|nr:hypothetical protein ANN_17768 [Periplaneta americana]